MSHGKFKYASSLASEDVAGYLESLAAGIRQREVHFESGNESATLRIADEVSFECSVRDNPEKGRAGFALTVDWRSISGDDARTSAGLHVVPASQMDEQVIYADDFVDRDALASTTPAEPRSSSRVNAATGVAKTPSAAPKRSSRKTPAKAKGRPHARRRVAS